MLYMPVDGESTRYIRCVQRQPNTVDIRIGCIIRARIGIVGQWVHNDTWKVGKKEENSRVETASNSRHWPEVRARLRSIGSEC